MKNELMYMEINKATMNLKDDMMSELCRKFLTKIRRAYGGSLSYVTSCRKQVMTVEVRGQGKIIEMKFAKGKDKKYRVKDISVMDQEEKK